MSAEYPRDPAYREPIREREVIVTDGDRGPGGVIATLIGIAALVLIVWLLITSLGGSDAPTMEVPDDINVNVQPNDGAAEPDAGAGG